MNEERILHDAVAQKNVSAKQSILQKLFAFWFDAFVYNQIWEDPRVDLEALQLDADSRVLTISSGGCNALNYLCESPRKVTAVDLNRQHIFLLRLKIAAIRFLPNHEDFFNFFAHGKHPQNLENYRKFIAPNLDETTRAFWEGTSFFGLLNGGARINIFERDGLYEHSRNGYFLRFFHSLSQTLGCKPKELLKANSLAEQEELFTKFISPFFDWALIKFVGKLPVTLFGLGIPPQQYDELKKDLSEGASVIDIYRERAHRLATKYPIDDNYFAWQAFARKYDTENLKALPEYLKAENFHVLKQNISRIETEIVSVTEKIKLSPRGTFNRFVFLDAQDWMNADALNEFWSTIAVRAESGARIIFRTASSTSPIETHLQSDLRARFHYEEKLSRELFEKDRASIYGGFHLYSVK